MAAKFGAKQERLMIKRAEKDALAEEIASLKAKIASAPTSAKRLALTKQLAQKRRAHDKIRLRAKSKS